MSENPISIGSKQQWGRQSPLLLYPADRRRHLYVVGQTGVGKSTLLKSICAQDIDQGSGLALLDPHGDLAMEVLNYIPSSRVDDVVFVDPTDIEQPVAFNPLFRIPQDERALVAANLVQVFKSQYSDSWGPRLEYILFNVFRALLDAPDEMRPSFLGVPRVLVDERYRKRLTRHIKDVRTRCFFEDELDAWPERQLAEAISPIQNKIGQFLANPFTRNVLCQWKPSFDLAKVMNEGKILIVRIPKGILGEEQANLFGSFFVTGLQQAAMKRAARPEAERRDFHLIIDEFPNFATESFSSILSEARKYGLTLTLAHQFIDQMSKHIEKAVFGNVGSLISFRVSAEDAIRLAKEIGEYSPDTFRSLERGQICGRMLERGEPGNPFLGFTVYDASIASSHRTNILAQSRACYGRDRQKVETSFGRWLN